MARLRRFTEVGCVEFRHGEMVSKDKTEAFSTENRDIVENCFGGIIIIVGYTNES